MRIEVGKTYKTREGTTARIVDSGGSYGYRFRGFIEGQAGSAVPWRTASVSWTEYGVYIHGAIRHKWDLVEETVTPPSQYWVIRRGAGYPHSGHQALEAAIEAAKGACRSTGDFYDVVKLEATVEPQSDVNVVQYSSTDGHP